MALPDQAIVPPNTEHESRPRPGGGRLPTMETVPLSRYDQQLNDFLGDEDDEVAQVDAMRETSGLGAHNTHSGNIYSVIQSKIDANFKTLRSQVPQGGLKAYRFITRDILLSAPADFFTRYEEQVDLATTFVQENITAKGFGHIIERAQRERSNDQLQDEAFRVIQSLCSEYLTNTNVRGPERHIITYMATSDIMGLSRLEPLWLDPDVTEILVNGPYDVQVETHGTLHKVPSCQFRDTEHLENLIERIFGPIGKSLSRTTPYLDGRLYDQSRVAATHTVIAPQGPNLSVRKAPDRFWTPMDLVQLNAASEEMLTDVGNLIYKGCSFVVIGGTSTGKTTVLNAFSGFFNPTQRILTLEDNLELKPNPHKLFAAPMECVAPNMNKVGDEGVTMRELVRASLRMRPDGIVIGEVRDGAMYDLCQALNTGHWGASTVHANSPEDGIYRMQSLAAQASVISDEAVIRLIASAFDFIIMLERLPEDGSRKITQISEVATRPTIQANGRSSLEIKPLWEFVSEGVNENDVVLGHWEKRGELSDERRKSRRLDLMPDLSWDELKKLATI